MGHEPLEDWLRLTLIPGIGGETQRKLLAAFGLPSAVFAAGFEAIGRVVGERAARLLSDSNPIERIHAALEWARGAGQRIVTLADSEYPQRLLETDDPPTVLYVRGRVELLNRDALAIVGSRNPTPQGIQNAESFARAFAEAGLTITSGLALGIDAAAHRGALAANGNTVAFIGTGIDRIYPARNRDLALDIAARGCVVSEFPIGTPVTAFNFPRRNRLISGFSLGVLVVEAATESGSLITARLAGEQGREVFAIPGSIHSPQSKGCHRLIKQGAKLVECADDVLGEIRWSAIGTTTVSSAQAATADQTTQAVLEWMGFDPCTLDELCQRSGLPADRLAGLLLHLEMDGQVAGLAGGRYQRLATL